jgi:hypothetical protein
MGRQDLGDVPTQAGRQRQAALASRKSPARIATILLRALTLGTPPAGLGLVDDVVVIQGSLVHELDRHRP